MDLVLMNKTNHEGWVAINCIPTAAHTIWGSLAGKLLLTGHSVNKKIKYLILAGTVCAATGFVMDWTITPIIKKIATTSFTLATGGLCLMLLAFCYWWIDIKNHKKNLVFFYVMGMNSIFIYLFSQIVGRRWFNEYSGAITDGLMSMVHTPYSFMILISPLCVFALEWGLCYFLYRNKIFIKL